MTKHPIGEQLSNSLPLFVKGEPYTIDEMDQHPDAQRIWSTIQEVVSYQWEEYDNLGYIYTQKEWDYHGDSRYDEGFSKGINEGMAAADKCYQDGYTDGKEDGYDQGYKDGYDLGWTDGRDCPVPDNY
jgi:hypothetical protein